MTYPTGSTLLQGRPYKNAASTDVRETWKRFGWQPPPKPQQPQPGPRS